MNCPSDAHDRIVQPYLGHGVFVGCQFGVLDRGQAADLWLGRLSQTIRESLTGDTITNSDPHPKF